MAKEFVKVATYSNSEEAHLARIRLAESGIDCIILGEHLLMAVPKVGFPQIEVHVPAEQAEKAIEILKQARQD